MAAPRRKQAESSISRGIQNTEVRFERKIEERLLQERLLNATAAGRSASEKEKAEELRRQQITELEEQEEQMQMQQLRIAQMNAAYRKRLLAKRTVSTRTSPKGAQGFARFMRLSTLLWLGWIQFVLACGYAVSFGFKLTQSAFCSTTVGGVVCTVTGIIGDAISFIGGFNVSGINLIDLMLWCFGGLIATFTISIVIAVLLASITEKERPLQTPASIVILAFFFMLNMVPVLNLVPWILIWAGMQLLGPSLSSVSKLSSAIKKP